MPLSCVRRRLCHGPTALPRWRRTDVLERELGIERIIWRSRPEHRAATRVVTRSRHGETTVPQAPVPPLLRMHARAALMGCGHRTCIVYVRERVVRVAVSAKAGAPRHAVSTGRRHGCGGETGGGEFLQGMGTADRGGQPRWRRWRDRCADGRQCAARRLYAV